MLHVRTVEIWVGVFIAGALAALFVLAMKVSNLSVASGSEGYQVSANFENIGGLRVRSPVSIAGVRIGQVADISFDATTFEAVVTMRIEGQYDQLPVDTTASIFTSGLLGENYIGLEPGGDIEMLKDGSHLQLTQSALILEQLIGQFLFSQSNN